MALWEYEIKDGTIKVDCLGSIYAASVEDEEQVMARIVDILMETKEANTIILSQARDFEYDFEQTQMLLGISMAIRRLMQDMKILRVSNFEVPGCTKHASTRMSFLQKLITIDMRKDPIGAYVNLLREFRILGAKAKHLQGIDKQCTDHYISNAILAIKRVLESAKLIQIAIPFLDGHHVGSREIYRNFFHPVIRPNFMLTRYMMVPPKNGQMIDRYPLKEVEAEVEVFKVPDAIQKVYHVSPPEFTLTEEEYTLLDIAREYMAAHKPSKAEFAEPEKIREMFFNIGKDMISEIADNMSILLEGKKLSLLAKILTRYTAGYGILEIILSDPKVQDVYINSPVGQSPVYLFHADHEECVTNIIPTREDAMAWATRFRIESGRPLDEANPVLDTEIEVPGGRARIAAITKSLSPEGLAFAFRRHREKPWTYPLFIHNKALNSLAAGLMSFLIDGARTILVAGTRSSGKTSLLGATISEVMKKVRILTIEDTLELPIPEFKNIGYNIERLKARSVITHIESELSADEAIRTSLRLGDSALILGEVRSVEAKALYEAMRIGALANVVAGTIHGDSPYGVFDRVVNDLGVPATSFKATDIIVIVNRLRSADGLHSYRRVVEITEVRKDWKTDPKDEKGFVPLMVYNSKTDQLEPTDTLLNGESIILNEIAKKVKDWRDNWEAVWSNIQLRAKMKQAIVDYALKSNNLEILEAPFVIEANDKFHIISERVKEEYGILDSERIFARWNEWVQSRIKK